MLTKRSALILLAVALLVPLLWWLQIRMRPQQVQQLPMLQQAAAPETLSRQMAAALDAYYLSAGALTRNDSTSAAHYAGRTDSLLRLVDLHKGFTDTANISFLESLKAGCMDAAKLMATGKNLSEQRVHFETMSNTWYDLLRAGRFLSIRTYKIYCPMAFNNRGAHWLSPNPEVVNPYFGTSMLHCGEVKDSMGTTTTPH